MKELKQSETIRGGKLETLINHGIKSFKWQHLVNNCFWATELNVISCALDRWLVILLMETMHFMGRPMAIKSIVFTLNLL
jgi:hypothetical protein